MNDLYTKILEEEAFRQELYFLQELYFEDYNSRKWILEEDPDYGNPVSEEFDINSEYNPIPKQPMLWWGLPLKSRKPKPCDPRSLHPTVKYSELLDEYDKIENL